MATPRTEACGAADRASSPPEERRRIVPRQRPRGCAADRLLLSLGQAIVLIADADPPRSGEICSPALDGKGEHSPQNRDEERTTRPE